MTISEANNLSKGKYIICKSESNVCRTLTKNKSYEIIDIDFQKYNIIITVLDDYGINVIYSYIHFDLSKSEIRNDKINKLLNKI
jgi:S-adenosylmethionine:tRNA-ribosyltransferase-isomerase (queuine synthetase)